ncbi:putative sugar phosphate transporter domain-containing protein [Helianthus anomalus]
MDEKLIQRLESAVARLESLSLPSQSRSIDVDAVADSTDPSIIAFEDPLTEFVGKVLTAAMKSRFVILILSSGNRKSLFPDLWLKLLFLLALAHTIGHVAATISMSKVAVSFTHIIKSGEPAFSVLVSRFILGETFPMSVYLSLLPIIGGCGLAALNARLTYLL